jgi:hypothetical protein
MTVPQILVDLMKLLFDLAVPAAICTMVLAGIALRREGGVNFQDFSAADHFTRSRYEIFPRCEIDPPLKVLSLFRPWRRREMKGVCALG